MASITFVATTTPLPVLYIVCSHGGENGKSEGAMILQGLFDRDGLVSYIKEALIDCGLKNQYPGTHAVLSYVYPGLINKRIGEYDDSERAYSNALIVSFDLESQTYSAPIWNENDYTNDDLVIDHDICAVIDRWLSFRFGA